MLAELAMTAGLPAGVLNVIHGARVTVTLNLVWMLFGRLHACCTSPQDAVNFICDDPYIKAISFVGSGPAGKHIFARYAVSFRFVPVSLFPDHRIVILQWYCTW